MFNVGDVEILRVEESLGHGFQPNVLLPDWNAKDIEPHLPWLAPTYYDPAVDKIVSSIHSWVLKTKHHTILIDTCVGNHKERPGQPRFHMLEPALHGELRQGRTEGGGHRLRAVHAPARRPRRLEHAARQRPLGADVPQRQVCVLQDRPRLLRSDARRRRQDRGARARVQRQRAADPGSQAGHDRRRQPRSWATTSPSRRRRGIRRATC